MMMPANYSVIAENELTYVTGGGVIANVLPAIMTQDNWKNVTTNIVYLVGNSGMAKWIGNTIGVMFGGDWGGDDGQKIFGEGGALETNVFGKDKSFLNNVMTTLQGIAVVYTLGSGAAKTLHTDSVIGINGTTTL